jgi:SOS-response transcriptional repressor LexA
MCFPVILAAVSTPIRSRIDLAGSICMETIFAIIAIYSQGYFAIIAISFFAEIANNSNMKDLNYENRKWLADKLIGAPRGTKGKVAEVMGQRPDVVARIINFSGKGETRNISVPELHALAKYFQDTPPGLIGSKELPPSPERHARELVRVPLLDSVSAGKLKQPLSQIHIEDVPLLAFADLGKGDFFALTVEGDSMDRIAPEGAMIVVDRSDTTLVSNKPYVLSDRGHVTFKLWKPNPPRWAPASTNPIHEPIFVKTKEAAERMVVGRVKRAVLDL